MSAKQQQVAVAVGAVPGGAAEAHNHSKVQLLLRAIMSAAHCVAVPHAKPNSKPLSE